jgi:hypothetical protein
MIDVKLCEGIEQCFPVSPAEKFAPKKFRRFKKRLLTVEPNKRRGSPTIRSCIEVDQDLFHEFAPPTGPVRLGLEDLIRITVEKRAKRRLADRRIQVPGKRMERFVPPQWKPKQKKQ